MIPNMSYGRVPYEEGTVNFQVEYTRNVTMEVYKENIVDDMIHACMLQLSIKAYLKRFGNKGEEAAQK